MSYKKGIAYICLWYTSILAGYAGIFCPLLPLIFISNKLYRRVTDFVLTFWQMYPAALLEFLYGCKIYVTGDAINSEENILLIMNHRTRTDWNFLWPAMYQAINGKNRWFYPTKFVLKDSIRHIPGIGWMMQLGSYVYIKRHWEDDKLKLSRAINFFADLRSKFCLLLFPEGTDLTSHTRTNSNRYADKLNLPHYEHVLHPRTTGFCYLTTKMMERNILDAVYDVTIAYVDCVPQTEMYLINGKIPKEICVHFKRFELNEIGNTETQLQHFLEARWREKERILEKFNAQQYSRLTCDQFTIRLRPNRRDLIIALLFWTLLPIPVLYMLITSQYLRYTVAAHTAFLLTINYIKDGFQTFEIDLHMVRQWIKQRFVHEHHDN